MNTDDLDAVLKWVERRVLETQTKLHRWAMGNPHRMFEDLFNLVTSGVPGTMSSRRGTSPTIGRTDPSV